MNQPYTYDYPLTFGLPSHLGHHSALGRVPCAIKYVPSPFLRHDSTFLGTMAAKSITSEGPCCLQFHQLPNLAERSWPLWKSSSANIFNNFRMSHSTWPFSRNLPTNSFYVLRVGQRRPPQEGDTSPRTSQIRGEIDLFSLQFRAF